MVKYFFWNRYLWGKQKDCKKIANGFRCDVSKPPNFLIELCNKLKDDIDCIPNIACINYYDKNNSLNSHKDENFTSDVKMYSMFNDSRLGFKLPAAGIYGHGTGFFAIPIIKHTLIIMKKKTFVTDVINHEILSKDQFGKRGVIILRTISQQNINDATKLKQYRTKCIEKEFKVEVTHKNYQELKTKYCDKRGIKIYQFLEK